ncbi:MAG TPA: alpha/beta fold hydrolase [Smithellaceae bacterium]|nr:alpha/beta fold hydrolase [Smithellaceae bacterium]HQO13760.1 alpha/beta fold hydrolase [Smithellaceae bacterium]HQQ88033.1 alpha/beta fold hydrolase [Smithellaceae bacterium]
MEISNVLIKTIVASLDVLTRVSGMDIRVHGKENVPDQPVLYVVNHFTRLETVLMPYIIKKTIQKYPLSLADKSFFNGRMGHVMAKLGAISTADLNRDALLIRALLKDSNPVIIFPEGQMIKDKRLIEKGRYMVFNTGARRPPHTGAGRIALRSQFIREELKLFRERGDDSSIKEIARHFGFDAADVDKILQKETYIVPVNVTYYPIQARENVISRLLGRFVEDISGRFEEEMLIEGSMVTQGVDIDVNFGRAIPMKKYIKASARLHKMLSDQKLYLHPGELKYAAPFKKLYIRIMYEYMDAIYSMTTVNHDHLFSYVLSKYRKNKIREDDYKNRVFLAIENLRRCGLTNYHTSLNKKQFYLLTDDVHEKYERFISSSTAAGLISLEKGCLIKNKYRFSKTYDFHTIRKDNIIEVLKNEIEPLWSLTKALNRLMLLPDSYIKRKIRNHFIELDKKLFEDDYQKYFLEGESKPKNIGAPFFWKHMLGKKGVILVHGYMAAPEEIKPLAEYLYKNGYSIYGVRLRGHGTAPEDLASRNWEKWYDSAGRAYIIMKSCIKSFAIAGFSTGGDIALLQAANKPGRFKAVISINAPLRLQHISSKLASVIVAWNKLLTKFKVQKGKMEFVENDPDNPHINYLRNPVYGVYQLEKLMQIVEEKLENISEPVLVLQGSNDPVVNPVSGREIYKKVKAKKKIFAEIKADRHGILRGVQAEKVNAKVLDFLDGVF